MTSGKKSTLIVLIVLCLCSITLASISNTVEKSQTISTNIVGAAQTDQTRRLVGAPVVLSKDEYTSDANIKAID